MPLNILILPLLGGYFFVTHWNRTKHRVRRQNGRRLAFESAFYGVFLLILSFALVLTVETYAPAASRVWERFVPFDYSGTSTLAFLFGALGWRPLNRFFFDESEEIERAIKKNDDYLEGLLERAMTEEKLVSATTSRGKVYIGEAAGNFLPTGERKYIKILPYVSGYRDPTTQQLTVTTWYYPVYDQIDAGAAPYAEIDVDDFAIVFPITELHSINLFSQKAYQLFQEHEEEAVFSTEAGDASPSPAGADGPADREHPADA